MGFTTDLFHVTFKAISATLFCAKAEFFTTADAVVTHISSHSFFIAQYKDAKSGDNKAETLLFY